MAATEVEKLVVQLSADFKSYENAMAKASGITRKQLAQIKADAANVGTGAGAAFNGASAGVRRFGNDASKVARQTNALQGQTANLAAQFQDIAVQLQSGSSPFTIALQQGTQISSVLGGAGAGGAVKALGGAFASLVSPVSLVTIGLIAAGGAAIQYISAWLDGGEKTEEELKKQSQMIQQVAKDWGDAVPFVKAYAEEVERASKAADLKAAGEAIVADIWAPATEQVRGFRVEVEDAVQKLMMLGADTTSIVNLQDAMANLEDKVKDQSATADDAEAVVDALNATMAGGVPITGDLASGLAALANTLSTVSTQAAQAESQINGALNAMRTFRAADQASMAKLASQTKTGADWVAEQERINGLTAEQLTMETEIAAVKGEAAKAEALISPEKAVAVAQGRLAAEERRAAAAKAAADAAREAAKTTSGGGGGGGSRARANELEREINQTLKQTSAVQAQTVAQAGLNPAIEDYGYAVARAKAEQELLTAAQQAGVAITGEVRANIDSIADGYAQAVQTSGQLRESQQRIEEHTRDIADMQQGFASDMVRGFLDGASAAEVLANALANVGQRFLDMALNSAFSSGGFGGFFGGGRESFGGGSFAGNLVGAFAHHSGGIVGRDGTPRLVNPSVFAGAKRYHSGGLVPGEVPAILQRGERVLTRGQQAAMGGGGVAVEIMINDQVLTGRIVNVSGQVAAKVVDKRAPGAVAKAQARA